MSDPFKERQRRAILSEEEYTSTLSEIVQRDYFPDLPTLRRQVAVLDRRAAGDIAGAVAIRRAARQLEHHEEALAQQDDDDEHDVTSGGGPVRKRPRPLHRESVTGFHARVTSEDNQEFDETQKRQMEANKERLQKVFNPLRITYRGSGSETPLLASDQFTAPAHRIESSQWKDTDIGANGVFFSPQHVVPSENSSIKLLTNATGGGIAAGADNQLMPPPAPIRRQSSEALASTAIVVKQDLVEYIPKHALVKRIEPSQTRFPAVLTRPPPRNHLSMESESSTDYSTEATTDLDEPALPVSVEREARMKRQRREQETLVAMTPLLVPGRAGESGNESPIITWGTVSGTPMVLGGNRDRENDMEQPQQSFTMPAENARDRLARLAGDKMEQAKRKLLPRPSRSKQTPILWNRATTASLTPAARSLLEKTAASESQLSSSVRSKSAFASALRSSYTPLRRQSSRSVTCDHAAKATPLITSGDNSTTHGPDPPTHARAMSGGNITDGLLKLPK